MSKLFVILVVLMFVFTACADGGLYIIGADHVSNKTQNWESECGEDTCTTYIETLSSSSP